MSTVHYLRRRLAPVALGLVSTLAVGCQDPLPTGSTQATERPAASVNATLASAPFAYVTHPLSNKVSVISTATNSVVATVPVGQRPQEVALTPDGAFAYVAVIGGGSNPTVSVISTADNTVAATITIPIAIQVNGVAITPDGKFVYVTGEDTSSTGYPTGYLGVIAAATNTIVASIGLGVNHWPGPLVITPDGAYAYVADTFGLVWVIRTADNTIVTTIPGVAHPDDIAITPDGRHVWVTSNSVYSDNFVYVITTAYNAVSAQLPFYAARLSGVAFTPDGSFAYVADRTDGEVVVIARWSHDRVATVPIGFWPTDVAITPDGAFVYVPEPYNSRVSVIATATNSVVARVPVSDFPWFLAIAPQQQTPEQAIIGLEGQVDALVAAGTLSVANGHALKVKLDAALAQLARASGAAAGGGTLAAAGATSNASHTAAVNQLNAFIHQIDAFVRSGRLTADDAQPLIDLANQIIQALLAP
jgi:YVTN family beta-propeller protein